MKKDVPKWKANNIFCITNNLKFIILTQMRICLTQVGEEGRKDYSVSTSNSKIKHAAGEGTLTAGRDDRQKTLEVRISQILCIYLGPQTGSVR